MVTISLSIMFNLASTQFDLPKDLLASICFVESSNRSYVIHKDDGHEDSIGLCQLHLTTARWLGFKGTRKQLLDPYTNIYYAAKYLNYQNKRYKGHMDRAIIAYNRGHYSRKHTKYYDKVVRTWRGYVYR